MPRPRGVGRHRLASLVSALLVWAALVRARSPLAPEESTPPPARPRAAATWIERLFHAGFGPRAAPRPIEELLFLSDEPDREEDEEDDGAAPPERAMDPFDAMEEEP